MSLESYFRVSNGQSNIASFTFFLMCTVGVLYVVWGGGGGGQTVPCSHEKIGPLRSDCCYSIFQIAGKRKSHDAKGCNRDSQLHAYCNLEQHNQQIRLCIPCTGRDPEMSTV